MPEPVFHTGSPFHGGYGAGRPPVHPEPPGPRRARAFGWFLLAVLFALFCERVAPRIAGAVTNGIFGPLLSSLVFFVLVVCGFAVMAAIGQMQSHPFREMGLVRRPGIVREWGLGALLGWGGIVACVLPVAIAGGLYVTLNSEGFVYGITALLADTLTLFVATLTAELIFRGYAFQRLIDTTGVTLATLLMSLLFAIDRLGSSPLTLANVVVSFLFGLLLAVAFLRTRALWVGWGLHFAWNATTAILFGLPIAGQTQFSPVFETYSESPTWLSGAGFGPEGSLCAIVVMGVLFLVLARTTRELRHRWAFTEPAGGGVPVDIDALSRAQHAAGMGPGAAAAEPAPLIQIAPTAPRDRGPR